jgi:hypothetical protein
MKNFLLLFTGLFFFFGLTTCTQLKNIEFVALEAKFKPNRPVVRVGEQASFEQASPPEVIKEYLWDFGDNTQPATRLQCYGYL